MIEIQTPLTKDVVTSLRIGDEVMITGTIVTGRDMAHKHLVSQKVEEVAPLLKQGVIYHCGPIVRRSGENFSIVSAGPTTSIREEPYQAKVIKQYKVAAVIGKGGMGEKTRQACIKHGAVYLESVGGAAAFLARTIKKVEDVFFLDEFGTPEAMWVLRVEEFPAIVTIDSTGADLHEKVLTTSEKAYKKLLR